MPNPFFEHPVPNSPYVCPTRHWELDEQGQPTQHIIDSRRRAEFITPIPRPRNRKRNVGQESFVFDEGQGRAVSTDARNLYVRDKGSRLLRRPDSPGRIDRAASAGNRAARRHPLARAFDRRGRRVGSIPANRPTIVSSSMSCSTRDSAINLNRL
jgi:hypothetical protein